MYIEDRLWLAGLTYAHIQELLVFVKKPDTSPYKQRNT